MEDVEEQAFLLGSSLAQVKALPRNNGVIEIRNHKFKVRKFTVVDETAASITVKNAHGELIKIVPRIKSKQKNLYKE